MAALAIREGRSVSDVIRRLIRIGIYNYAPEDRRPLPPTARKIASLSTQAAEGDAPEIP